MSHDNWEYKTMSVDAELDDEQIDAQLTPLGKDGWELLSVNPMMDDGSTTFFMYTFRRRAEKNRSAGFMA